MQDFEQIKKMILEQIPIDVLNDIKNMQDFDFEEFLNSKTVDYFNFAKEEKRIINLKNDAIKDSGNLIIENINGIRNYLMTIVGFSLTILVGVFSLYLKEDFLFKNRTFFIIFVILFFLLCIVLPICFLTETYYKENQKLTTFLNFHKNAYDKLHNFLIKTMIDGKKYDNYLKGNLDILKENREEEQELFKSKKSNGMIVIRIVTYSFIIAILFLGWFFF